MGVVQKRSINVPLRVVFRQIVLTLDLIETWCARATGPSCALVGLSAAGSHRQPAA